MSLRLIAPFLGLLFLGLLRLGGLDDIVANNSLDLLFRLRGPVAPAQQVIIIGVDEPSLQQYGAWPFPRHLHAQLLARLNQARAVGFDFLFPEPTADDPLLSAAMAIGPPVVLTIAHEFDGRISLPSATLTGQVGIGHIETILAGDGIVRMVRLGQDAAYPPFSQAMLKAAGISYLQTDQPGPLIINFYGPEETFLYLSYADVLSGAIPEAFFHNHLVLIGARATGLGDSHITSFTRTRATPGVEIQATIISNLMQHSFIRPLPVVDAVLIAVIALMALMVWPATGERVNLVLNLGLLLAILAAAVLLFARHSFLNYALIALFLLFTYLVHLICQMLRAAGRVVGQARRLGQQLDTGLQQVYANIPQQFIHQPPGKKSLAISSIQRHLDRLQAVINALSLQHLFLENLLKKELPPLILWETGSGAVIFANTGFFHFWRCFSGKAETPQPLHDHFMLAIASQKANAPPSAEQTGDDQSEGQRIIRIQDESGRNRYFQITLHPLPARDIAFEGILAVLQDVTELKELERVKDEVVSIVSHELKLPLTTILGYGEILADSLHGDHQFYAQAICDQSRRLNRMIEDFLDIARLENSRQPVRRYPFPLTRVLEDAISTVSPRSRKKNIQLHLDMPAKVTPFVGDEPLLLQAVINLLDNAVKFSPPATTVTLRLQEEAERFVVLVIDQGPGIAASERERIFDKFHRGGSLGSEKGFGLGLHLVKQIVDRHKGEIAVLETETGAALQILLPKYFH